MGKCGSIGMDVVTAFLAGMLGTVFIVGFMVLARLWVMKHIEEGPEEEKE